MTRHTNRLPLIDVLESRRLYSAAPLPTVTLTDGVLAVVGTARKDTVLIAKSATDPATLVVTANKKAFTFAAADVRSITASMLAGNDKVVIDAAITAPTTLDGGAGNDTLDGGGGDDVITGDAGNDSLSGGSGNDRIDGGAGNDAMAGGVGDDDLNGEAGNDRMTGGADNDSLAGGAGSDQMSGDAGDDDLDGQAGKNRLAGGPGADAFATGSGGKEVITDRSAGVDTTYQPYSIDKMPQEYQNDFNGTFPDSTITGFRVNSDDTWSLQYTYTGDGKPYHVTLTNPGGGLPFSHMADVSIKTTEYPSAALPPLTSAAFFADHPGAVIDSVQMHHIDGEGTDRVADVRYHVDGSGIQSTTIPWLDEDHRVGGTN